MPELMEDPQERPKEDSNDERGMEETLRAAEGVLMDAHLDELQKEIKDERAGQQNALNQAQEVLDSEAENERLHVSDKIGEFIKSFPPEKDFHSTMQEHFGWTRSQTDARLDALQGEFWRFYNSEFDTPDDKQLEPGSRDSRAIMKQITEEDYGPEFAKSVAPLIDLFVERSIEMIKARAAGKGGK